MFKKSTSLAFLGIFGLFYSAASLADSSISNLASTGQFYVDGGMGYGKTDTAGISLPKLDENGLVYTFGGGYQFNNYLGLEAGYTRFPDVKASKNLIAKDNKLIDIAAKGILPLSNKFNVFGKLGVARVGSDFAQGVFTNDGRSISGSQSKILPYLGAGLGYSLTQNVDFSVQLAGSPRSGVMPAMYGLTAGITYKF